MTSEALTISEESVLLDAAAVARLLSCSVRHVRRLDAGCDLPAPIHLGRAVRWRKTELLQWINAGCPARQQWDQLKKNGKR